jgi:hypothetical protein
MLHAQAPEADIRLPSGSREGEGREVAGTFYSLQDAAAKALGVSVPASLLGSADLVIE